MASGGDLTVSAVERSGAATQRRSVHVRGDSGLTTDALIPVTIGVLAAAFSAMLVILVIVCRRRHCRLQTACRSGYLKDSNSNSSNDNRHT